MQKVPGAVAPQYCPVPTFWVGKPQGGWAHSQKPTRALSKLRQPWAGVPGGSSGPLFPAHLSTCLAEGPCQGKVPTC